MISTLSRRRTAQAVWESGAQRAQPGEVWTARYATETAVTGGRFESWTAGPVHLLGDECPVESYRGQVTLGEQTLRPAPSRWRRFVDLIAPMYSPTNYTLVQGDAAPVVLPGSGADLEAAPTGTLLMVEHRSDYPVCTGIRNVEIGKAGDVGGSERLGHRRRGRYVGDSWVILSEVTGVQIVEQVTR